MVEPRPDRTVGDSNPAEYGLPRQVAACMTRLLSGQGVAREPPVQPVVPPPASGPGEFQDQNEWQAEWQLVLVRACLVASWGPSGFAEARSVRGHVAVLASLTAVQFAVRPGTAAGAATALRCATLEDITALVSSQNADLVRLSAIQDWSRVEHRSASYGAGL